MLLAGEQLAEQPGVTEHAAGEHHGRDARLLEGGEDLVGLVQAAGQDHGRRQAARQLGDQLVVGGALVLDGRRAGVEGDRGHAGLGHQPLGQLEAARVTGPHPHRSFAVTGTGAEGPASETPWTAAEATARARSGSHSRAAPAPVLATFGTGHPMLMSIASAPTAAT